MFVAVWDSPDNSIGVKNEQQLLKVFGGQLCCTVEHIKYRLSDKPMRTPQPGALSNEDNPTISDQSVTWYAYH